MSQYNVLYNGKVIESTGYFASVQEAYEWACARYGSNGIAVQPVYPQLGEVYHGDV